MYYITALGGVTDSLEPLTRLNIRYYGTHEIKPTLIYVACKSLQIWIKFVYEACVISYGVKNMTDNI